MKIIPPINISDYDYPLPNERIAMYPLQNRDDSKLLVCRDDVISDSHFSEINEYIPKDSLLVLNDTRVIRARLLFQKTTGAAIEIFCMEPKSPVRDVQLAMQQTESCVWECLVRNAKKWKSGTLSLETSINNQPCIISAEITERQGETFLIKFTWSLAEIRFAQIIEAAGKVPLPPYIHRKAEEEDSLRYQTVFATHDGSVAAPTAGLHFTEKVFAHLAEKNIRIEHLTLHVGAGTFKPVSAGNIQKHQMHAEQVAISTKLITELYEAKNNIIAVGTTSVRSLESLYWLGVKYLATGAIPIEVNQWDAYGNDNKTFSTQEVLFSLMSYLHKNKLKELHFQTSLIIIPGYNFRIIHGMVTNFHQPKSTLLLLISAFLGDQWKEIYEHALQNNYRFLSYGDACLFL